MPRPDDRPLRMLPTLQARKTILERCVFCPKLCRSACPVSNADQRETVTPWGKMSMAYFTANGSVPLEESYAAPAWACTGCMGCRESCDHQNDVAGTLFEARSASMNAGIGLASAKRVLDAFEGKIPPATEVLSEVDPDAGTALLVGCSYSRNRPEVVRDAIRATAKLVGEKVAPIDICCGAPLLHAGAHERFVQQGEIFAQAVKHKKRLIVVDAGCASTILVHHANNGVGMIAPVEHFAERAAKELGALGRVSLGEGPVRWHDPCQLGRGLGIYEQPRQILSKALGRAPGEFERSRQDGRCSGAGGLLPVTMPATAKKIARERLDDHERSGGGTVVTACASSARSFEKEGAKVVDLVTVVARALGV